MNCISTILNYLCIALCALGLYSTSKFVALKPWKIDRLDQKIIAHIESRWSSKDLESIATVSGKAMGEKIPEKEPISVPTPVEAVTEPEMIEVVALDTADFPRAKFPEPLEMEVGVEIAIPSTPIELLVVEAKRKINTSLPKPAVMELTEAETPKPNVDAMLIGSDSPLLAKADPPQTQISSRKNTPNTNTPNTNSSGITPIRKTQTREEKPKVAPIKPTTSISLSSMLEVDLGAPAPR